VNEALSPLPVAQVYTHDVPDLPTPDGADLLQVLWCPFDHPIMPRTALFWRSAATVTEVLATPPEPCLLNPEQVTEYPDHLELSGELRERLGDWSVWEAADTGVDSSYAGYPQEFYDAEPAGAPGWKVGGQPRWGATDPTPRLCAVCGSGMDALLTIATFEDDGDSSWVAVRTDLGQTGPNAQPLVDFFRATPPRQPTAVQIGSGYDQQLYVCPAAPEHPHSALMH